MQSKSMILTDILSFEFVNRSLDQEDKEKLSKCLDAL